MVDRDIDIAPGDSHYVVKSSLTLPRDVEMSSVFPHAHLLCKDMKIDVTRPDGTITHLIWIKDWDFNWQGGYRFETPLHLPKGTRIDLTYTFDNSDANPRNPSHPAQRVTFGEQTTDEMAVGFLGVILPTPADVAPFQREMRLANIERMIESGGGSARLQQLMKTFDKNGDGKLDAEERAALMQYLQTVIK